MTKVGVLAIQGDYALHAERLTEIGADVVFVRKSTGLTGIDALVIPGGESTTLLKLIDDEFRCRLIQVIKNGLPTLGTCAGLILLASRVTGPEQYSLGCLNVTVERNSYGRQLDSFVTPALQWTREGRAFLKNSNLLPYSDKSLPDESDLPTVEGVFIRAPRIREVGANVQVLLTHRSEPVLVVQNRVLGATFHPEVTPNLKTIHELLLILCR